MRHHGGSVNSEPPGKLRDRHANGSLLDEIVYFFGLQTRLPLPCRPAAFRSIAVTLGGIFRPRSTLTSRFRV